MKKENEIVYPKINKQSKYAKFDDVLLDFVKVAKFDDVLRGLYRLVHLLRSPNQ